MTPTFASAAARLWANNPRGQRLLALEVAAVQRVLPDLFGRHFLQIGTWGVPQLDWLAGTAMLHHAVLALNSSEGGHARVDSEHLPFASRSIDAVLLPHTLEHLAAPHGLLREVSRVLSDRGRLLLLGFNPYSSLGLRRLLGLAPKGLPPQASHYSTKRIMDWLKLLDFEVVEVRRFGAGFPWGAPRSDGVPMSPRALLAPLSEAYCVHAKKRVLSPSGRLHHQRAQVTAFMPLAASHAANDQAQLDKK